MHGLWKISAISKQMRVYEWFQIISNDKQKFFEIFSNRAVPKRRGLRREEKIQKR